MVLFRENCQNKRIVGNETNCELELNRGRREIVRKGKKEKRNIGEIGREKEKERRDREKEK